jgi:hypothetical protein
MRLCCDFCDPGKTGHVCEGIKPEDSDDGKPLHAHLDIYIAAVNCDTIAKFAASLGQSERENPARWLTWLRRLRTTNVERVEDGIQKAPRITNLRQAREAAGLVLLQLLGAQRTSVSHNGFLRKRQSNQRNSFIERAANLGPSILSRTKSLS